MESALCPTHLSGGLLCLDAHVSYALSASLSLLFKSRQAFVVPLLDSSPLTTESVELSPSLEWEFEQLESHCDTELGVDCPI